jgi:hypothetical protein
MFYGMEYILHAGDVGSIDIINQLITIAPVIAVHGNGDISPVTDTLPDKQILTLGGKNILLTHMDYTLSRLKLLIPSPMRLDDLDLVIYGHSHSPEFRQRDGLLFFNPGAASIKMCYVTPSVGIITIDRGIIKGEIVPF